MAPRITFAWKAFLTIVLVVIAGCQTRPAKPAQRAEETPANTILGEHPRLFFRKGDLPRIHETIRTLPEAKTQWESLLKTDPASPVVYPQAGKPTQPDWQNAVLSEGTRAARCGFIYQMTGDMRYAARAKAMLLGYARQFDTNVNFELCSDFRGTEIGHAGDGGNNMGAFYSGELLMGAAAAYDCVYETLTPEERQTIENGFFRKLVSVLERFDYSKRQPGAAPDFMVNGGQWNGANLCNMGLTATGFVLNDSRLYQRGVRAFKLQLGRDMLADGFWIEEDLAYSSICMASMFNIAWMAKSCGYPEDLFHTVVQTGPSRQYDRRYGHVNVRASEDGAHLAARSLSMYLDAHLDYQYPNFDNGNWGWYPGRGSLKSSSQMIGMYTAGYANYNRPEYGFILQNVDRSKGGIGAGVTSLLYFGKPVDRVPPAQTQSRVYPHARWIALKSIEGPAYWGSDSIYAFMPYGTGRSKGVSPFTLDIFAYNRVLAPRVGLTEHAQLLTGDYQFSEPAWNGVLTDGHNPTTFREQADKSYMAWQDLGTLVKAVSPRIHYLGVRRSELDTPDRERHPEEDRTVSRTLAMTDRYLVDVYNVVYDQPPKYKHNFDYVLHGYGKLNIESPKKLSDRMSDATAVWTQPDGVGLRTTILSGGPRGGTKTKIYSREKTDFLVATRMGLDGRFVVVHEPVKGPSRLAKIERISDTPDHIAIELYHVDGTIDFLALRIADTKTPLRLTRAGGRVEELKTNCLFIRTHPDGHEDRQAN